VVAEHTRDVADTPARAAAIKTAARGWADFWDGHLDLDALAVDVTEHLADCRSPRPGWSASAPMHASGGSISTAMTRCSFPCWAWARQPGPCIRAYFGDGSGFDSAKKAANYVGTTPSNWSSGTMNQSRRAISKEGPAPLRLAFFQSGSFARTMDPQLAAFYYRLMTEHGHCHTQALIAVARKLAERTWKTLVTGQLYELRDLAGQHVTEQAAKELIASHHTVTPKQRTQSRSHTIEAKRARLTR
jgi:hypothetical protein